jgi:putative ATP-dependent endonuclease of OLD family
LVDVRGTGLRRYARIFQRRNGEDILDIKVACVTDRDIMPNCAPGICIQESYRDIAEWPEKNRRKWRTESEFTKEELKDYIQGVRDKADGQYVHTFISDHWTFEYDLAYYGLEDKEMNELLIKTLVKSTYVDKNHVEKIKDILGAIATLKTIEEKASNFYQYFFNKNTSKADFAQQLAVEMEQKYRGRAVALRKVLPPYVKSAIDFVTTG